MKKQLKLRLKKLQLLPTLHVGQFDDLKVEEPDLRIWLSRMTVDDGMEYNNQVTVECYQHPKKANKQVDQAKSKVWVIVKQYEAI